MKVAMPVSAGRISSAFDFAGRLLVVEREGNREIRRCEVDLEEGLSPSRARRLEAMGARVVICGAISHSLAEQLTGSGIDVIPFVSGGVEEVLAAYFANQLDAPRFLMPGSTSRDRTEWIRRHASRGIGPIAARRFRARRGEKEI